MALAAAYQATGQQAKATEVIRHIWRTRPFDAATQQTMLARFGPMLRADDHVAREDMLLYGSQGPARAPCWRACCRPTSRRLRRRGWRCATAHPPTA